MVSPTMSVAPSGVITVPLGKSMSGTTWTTSPVGVEHDEIGRWAGAGEKRSTPSSRQAGVEVEPEVADVG